MLIDAPALYTVQTEFEDNSFFDICRVVFGINPEAVEDDNLRRAIFHAICDRFIGITVNDIQEAFSRYEPSEKVYVLSRKDFLEPIEKYWSKKNIIKSELKKEMEEMGNIQEQEQKRRDHKNESIQLYIECVNSDKVWKGTAFQAMVFAKESFAHRFSQPEKDRIYADAKQLVKELNAKRSYSEQEGVAFLEPVPNDVQMFSQLIVIEACKRGLEIIVG